MTGSSRWISRTIFTVLGISALSLWLLPFLIRYFNTSIAKRKRKAKCKDIPYVDFPYLQDDATTEFIKTSKTLFIMRGLPGSGKTTIVDLLKETYPNAVICSADSFFTDGEGVYKFDVTRLSEAHSSCKNKASSACTDGEHVVIIDNTNVRKWEMNYYIDLAARHNYTVILTVPQTPWSFNVEGLARRNHHGVPRDVLRRKVATFERVHPIFYGWFLTETDSDALTQMGEEYFAQCVDHLSDFLQAMRTKHSIADPSAVEFANIYSRHTQLLHSTAYCRIGRSLDENREYARKVRTAMGCYFSVTVIGFVITPRTVGARVKLTPGQLELWGKDDKEHRQWCSATDTSEPTAKKLVQKGDRENVNCYNPSSQSSRLGSRAHITLGYAQGHTAVETGFDQLEIVDLEMAGVEPTRVINLQGTYVKYYGEGRIAIILKKKVQFGSIFSGCY